MKRRVGLCVLLLFVLSASAVFSEDILMVFGEGGYAPFYLKFDKENKTTTGMFIDFLNEFMKAYPEYKIVFSPNSRIRMDKMMEDGEAQAFSLNSPIFAGDKAKDYIWSDPIWHTADCLYSLKTKPIAFVKNEDLYGKTIGCLLGNGYGEFDDLFKEKKIIDERVAASSNLYKLLIAERIDGFFGNTHNTPYSMKKNGFDPSLFVVADKKLFEFDLQVQINKKQTAFRDKLNAFIKTAKGNGIMKQIEDKWLK